MHVPISLFFGTSKLCFRYHRYHSDTGLQWTEDKGKKPRPSHLDPTIFEPIIIII